MVNKLGNTESECEEVRFVFTDNSVGDFVDSLDDCSQGDIRINGYYQRNFGFFGRDQAFEKTSKLKAAFNFLAS